MPDLVTTPRLHINSARLREDFEQLSAIGATERGGVNRPALSAAHMEARRWLKQRAMDAGLTVREDAAGNVILRLESPISQARTLIIGSHLDSVPNGGRYDGALGVLAGLEVLRVVKEQQLFLPVHLEAVDFTDEEGTLVSFLGSFAMSGKLTEEDILHPRGGEDVFRDGLRRAGLKRERLREAGRAPGELAGYLELHIEQGPVLEQAGFPIGVVQAISGIRFFTLQFEGRAHHAGTTPMERRQDAGLAAASFVVRFHQMVREGFPAGVGNIGQVNFWPGAFNIVPARAVLMVEVRAAEANQLRQMAEAAIGLAHSVSAEFKVGCEVGAIGERLPVAMDAGLQRLIRQTAEANGWKTMSIVSGAGHDAQSFADLCPTAVIFIPSHEGISHAEDEFSEWEDCLRGTELLLQVVLGAAQ
ncbi:MAG: Zn-dependent hydrolase [Chloroflexota bacterium]